MLVYDILAKEGAHKNERGNKGSADFSQLV